MPDSRIYDRPIVPGKEYNRARNVWGGSYDSSPSSLQEHGILILFTVPIEVMFRRRLGRRWLTFKNFLAGLFVLGLFAAIEWLISPFFNSYYYYWLLGFWKGLSSSKVPITPHQPHLKTTTLFLGVYVIRSIYHCFHMWWSSRTYTAVHSFSDGVSFLEDVSFCIMWVINKLATPFIRFFRIFLPRSKRKNRPVPLLLNNITRFNEMVTEPAFLLLLFIFCHDTTRVWLAISIIAMWSHARKKNVIRRNMNLDHKDSLVEAYDTKAFYDRQFGTAEPNSIFEKPKAKGKQGTPKTDVPFQVAPNLEQIIEDVNRSRNGNGIL